LSEEMMSPVIVEEFIEKKSPKKSRGAARRMSVEWRRRGMRPTYPFSSMQPEMAIGIRAQLL